jgi:PAS domain S-box-containing protein
MNEYNHKRSSMIARSDEANLKNTVSALQQEVARLLETEKRLAVIQSRYQSLVDEIDQGYFEVNLNGDLTAVNRALCDMTGYPAEELIGLNNRQYTSAETADVMVRIFNRLYQTGLRVKIADVDIIHKDGSTQALEMSVSLIRDTQGNPTGFRGLVRDLSRVDRQASHQRRLDAQRQQVQKMEAIETLAGSLALDFNNLLMGIQGNTSLLEMKIAADSPLRKNLDRINDNVDQGIHLTKQLLSFAKVGKFVVMPTDLNPIIHRSTRMFARNRSQIAFKRYLKNDIWMTDVDRVQMSQAILTLFMRAADDMPDGGDICIETDNVILDEEYVSPYGLDPGRYVRVSISDSGRGMDEVAQRRLFEPYFSATGTDAPTDLGLSAVYGILKSHAGLINVYSEPGHGTAFNLYLPVSKKESAPLADVTEHQRGNPITLLLIDDDETLLDVGSRILRRMGYRALTAMTGRAAMELYRAHHSTVRAILLDMIMPDDAAEEMLTAFKKCDPTVNVFLCSGFSRSRQVDRLLEKGFDGFIKKPFNRQELARQLNDALGVAPK